VVQVIDKVVSNKEVLVHPVEETAHPLPYLSVTLVSRQPNRVLKGISLNADLLRP
jgi:hypothetical protein